jgi:hypothetical protein
MNLTPKEKAKELISKYINIQNSWYLENLVDGLRIAQAKKCALINVNEMYNMASELDNIKYMNYLTDVETEIEKL